MIKIENTDVYGFKNALRGARNPMNSWDKSDSAVVDGDGLGPNDLDLLMRLSKAGNDHGKFMRMIGVWVDVTAPLYWWKEADTYKVGTVANSCSTMHKIASKEFTREDFSCEHLISADDYATYDTPPYPFEEPLPEDVDLIVLCGGEGVISPKGNLDLTIKLLNRTRDLYLKTKEKKYWWNMIQLLPSTYNQKRTLFLNYAVLKNIYWARKGHKLDEWHGFCHWIERLPYSELITKTKE